MIRYESECACEIRERMRGGEGSVKISKFWDPGSEMKSKNRLFAKLILEPGSSIGFHKHEKEDEIYVILKGEAEVNDAGNIVKVKPGDTILTGNGAGHSIKCVGNETLEVLAVISEYQ